MSLRSRLTLSARMYDPAPVVRCGRLDPLTPDDDLFESMNRWANVIAPRPRSLAPTGYPRSLAPTSYPRRWLVAALVLLLALAGCRLDISTTAEIAADGAGSVTVEMSMDEALVSALDGAQVDPTAALAAAVLHSDWRLARRVTTEGSVVVTLDRAVTSPDDLTAALRSLSEGLDEHAPALIVDLVIDAADAADAAGGLQVRGTAQVRPPDDGGLLIDGVSQGPSTEVLAALAAEMIDARLRLIFPGEVIEHDGDWHDGGTVEWQLPVGAERNIMMTTAPAAAPWWQSGLTGGLIAGGTLLLGSAALAVWLWRRARKDGTGGRPGLTGGVRSVGGESGSAADA